MQMVFEGATVRVYDRMRFIAHFSCVLVLMLGASSAHAKAEYPVGGEGMRSLQKATFDYNEALHLVQSHAGFSGGTRETFGIDAAGNRTRHGAVSALSV